MLLNWRAVTNFFSSLQNVLYRGFLMGQGVWDQATNLIISSSLWLLQFVLLLIFEQVQGEHFKRKCFSEGANSWVVELPGVHSQAVAPLNFSLWSTFKEQQQQKLNFISLSSLYPFFGLRSVVVSLLVSRKKWLMQGARAVKYLLGTRNVAVLRGERCSERGKSCPSPPTPCE